MRVLVVCIVLAGAAAPGVARAASCGETPEVLIVLDRSGSMKSGIGWPPLSKWNVAMTAVNKLATAFAGQLRLGLMLFPGSSSCGTGNVRVPCGPNTAAAIQGSMLASYPGGNTPIGKSVSAAGNYLLSIKNKHPQHVLLITDGMETCSGSPVTATKALWQAGITTFVVGFGTGVSPSALQAMASAGGTGKYHQADDLTQLTAALQAIAGSISCCGNGLLDGGEKCDTAIAAGQPGACPQSCDDGNPCTKDALDGAQCSATCTFTPITKPQAGDGCCPPGATFANDTDCPNLCGNGKLDANEACDTAIAAGSPGACPAGCDDGDPCTNDMQTGSGCDARCEHLSFCGCGNGVVDPGERCDTAITAGQVGACPTSCDDGDPCTAEALSGSGCHVQCTKAPANPDLSQSDGCCPQSLTSLEDADCLPPCGPDKRQDCVDLCASMTCPDGHFCNAGQCSAWPDGSGGGDPAPAGSSSHIQIGGGCSMTAAAPSAALILTLVMGMVLVVVSGPVCRRRRRRRRRVVPAGRCDGLSR